MLRCMLTAFLTVHRSTVIFFVVEIKAGHLKIDHKNILQHFFGIIGKT